jgi:hypothetical protein
MKDCDNNGVMLYTFTTMTWCRCSHGNFPRAFLGIFEQCFIFYVENCDVTTQLE